jgi:hypothetical protein
MRFSTCLFAIALASLALVATVFADADADSWQSGVSGQAFDFGSKLSRIHRFGRLGLSVNEFGSGSQSLVFMDLKTPIQPARSEFSESLDITQYDFKSREIIFLILTPLFIRS